jgi:single-stranded DNA-binding protein
MKKGSQIQLVGRLVQERWKQDDSNRSRVVVVAESISYLGSAPKSNGSDAKSESGDSSSVVPQEF